MSALSTRIVQLSAAFTLSLAMLTGFGHIVERSMDKLGDAIAPTLAAQDGAVKLSGEVADRRHG